MADIFGAVMADVCGLVVLDDIVLVLFGVDIDLLRAFFVLEADFVEVGPRAALGAAALDAALGLVGGQGVRRGLVAVVHPPGDDGPVGVAFEEFDDDFLAHARDVDAAPGLACPKLGHPHPAGGVFVLFAVPVPEELELYPPVFVGVDLFPFGADDNGGLWALDDGLGGGAGGPERGLAVDGGELVGIACPAAVPNFEAVAADAVVYGHHEVFAVLVVSWVAGQGEQAAGDEPPGDAQPLCLFVLGVQLLDAGARIAAAIAAFCVFPGVVIDLMDGFVVFPGDFGVGLEVGVGLDKVVFVQRIRARLQLLLQVPAADALLVAQGGLVGGVVGDFFVAKDAFVDVRVIDKQQGVLAFFVLVVVIDPFLFHQAADEVEVGLAVLDAIVPFPVGGPGVVLIRRVIEVLEHFEDDLRDGLVLEYPAIGGARQEPQPRVHGGEVPGVTAFVEGLGDAADVAVEVALLVAGQVEAEGDVLPQQVFELDVLGTEQFQFDGEQAAQFFGHREVAHQQHVFPQRGLEFQLTVFLGRRHIVTPDEVVLVSFVCTAIKPS